ncbi:MAG: hypothetical protein KAU36_02140 [candidate division Zixibacteria bacterium]|nr:hypothetical protein [candidate division Zixibacteria bacterium]
MKLRYIASYALLTLIVAVACGMAVGQASELLQGKVTLVTPETVYFNAGTAVGVAAGDSLAVVRESDTIAIVVVTHVASHSAAGTIAAMAMEPLAGDLIILKPFQAVTKPGTAGAGPATESVARKRTRPIEQNHVKGSISIQNQWHHDMSGSGLDWARPSLKTRLTVSNIGGSELAFELRHRTRLYYRSEPVGIDQDNHEWVNQVYEFSIGQEDKEASLEWAAGRITPPYVRGVGMIDGGYMAWRVHPNYRIGLAAGTSPDYRTTDLDFDRRKVGIFGSFESGSYQDQRIGLSLALSTAYEGTTVSRDYIYMQGTYAKAGLVSLYQSVEVDLNRAWRHDRTGERFTFSNYYGTANLTINKALAVFFSYDARKNLLYYETRNVPDSLFDDNTHKGFKAGFNLRLSNRVSVRGHGGIRYREAPSDDNRLGFLSVRLNRFPAKRHSVSAQLSVVETQFTTGYRPVLLYRFPLTRKLTINATGAGYIYKTGSTSTSNYYLNLNGMYNLGRRYYFTGGIRQYFDSELKSFELVTELGVRL